LAGVLWAYRNIPLNPQNKRSVPGYDWHLPTEIAFLPPEPMEYTEISDHQEKLILSLSSGRELAASNIRNAISVSMTSMLQFLSIKWEI